MAAALAIAASHTSPFPASAPTSTSLRPTRPSYLRALSSSSLLTTQPNKPRLYLALYPRGGQSSTFHSSSNCDSFHFALVVGPQTCQRKDPCTRYHLSHTDDDHHRHDSPFLYEESETLASPANVPLVRITLAKVRDPQRLTALLRSLSSPNDHDSHNSTTCLTWTRDAFALLTADKGTASGSSGPCLSSYLKASDWQHIEAKARKYMKRKRDIRRFDPDRPGPWDRESVSTWNFWENRESAV